MHDGARLEQITEVIKRNSDTVYRLAFSMVKTVQDAEDIRQEVFIQYIRKSPAFESPEHERAWFIRVTANLCKNLLKSAWRQKRVSVELQEETEDGIRNPQSVGFGPDIGRNPEEEFTEEEESVLAAVKKLPPKYRPVIHLFYYEEMSIEEIATALHLKPSNVRTRLTRARKMLKNWLKEDV